jgi:hypothetical protein
MKQIIYSMHFQGQTSPTSHDPHLIRNAASATSCTLRTQVNAQGVDGHHEAAEGDLAFLESEMRLTGPDSFSEQGTITFGEQHLLRFTTMQNGCLMPSAGPHTLAGAASWKVEGGEGQFAQATGLITSNFTLDETGVRNDYQLGVIFIP